MANVKKISVLLTAKNRMKKGLRSSRLAMRRWAKKAGKIARRGGLLIGAAFATGIGISIRSFLKLDAAMTKSLAITKGVSKEIRSEMLRTAQVMSKDALFAAHELAEGYFFLTSAGKSLTQSQVLLADVARFAQAGQFDLATATELLVGSQTALRLSSKNVAKDQKNLIRVSDVLVKANTLAQASVEEFAKALGNDAAAAMRIFGIELEEGVASLAVYAQSTEKGEKGGAAFARFLRLLIPSADKNAAAFKKLGIEVFDANDNLLPLADIVEDMENAFNGMGVRARGAALEVLGFQKKMQKVVFPS